MMKLNPFAMMNREPSGAGVVFDPENNKALTLNVTGVCIWESLAAELDEAQIVQRLIERFDVASDMAERDLRKFLEILKSKGLLSD